ncbi:transglutaminase-like domain-containing protein [Parasegetibacter sp. NRK P23]|uniref:transglutaminase-like domain-containing protein n=1 Tax=Parasegetibacter sp. NRK P23 TaxID=2942999 RepID=UPI002042D4D9|nr:transglutaminase-like domain-containing protein [Parasegetibacter sp. NRK P23]MCM5528262.1 transglutaminase-like domain-containing protein [Parasegetibacter sp. NRK P23]
MKVLMNTGIALVIGLCCALPAMAQPTNLAVSAIPDSLVKDADAVIRYNYMEFEVHSASKAVEKTRTIITVLNERAARYLVFGTYTDKFQEMGDVEIKVYDKNGILLSKAGKKQLTMESIGDGLIDDSKAYYYKVPANFYPITVEMVSETRLKGALHYPYNVIQRSQTAVEQFIFIAKTPPGLDLRYKLWNTTLQPKITSANGAKVYEWQTGGLKALRTEPKARNTFDQYPWIQIAPSKFEMDGYTGDMNSWEGLGKWYLQLFEKTGNLSEERKSYFRNMVKDEPTPAAKAKKIYDYLQQNFRYVSIQLGIGGWRPLPASFTDTKKYGDCKGLSNYMQAILAAVGIESYQTLINRGNDKPNLDPAFSVNSFNHEILCIPSINDTTWVECTSNTLDFGKLDASTENRPALLITPSGGVLVKTPKAKSSDHRLSIYTAIELSEADKSGKVSTKMNGTGEFKYLMVEGLQHRNTDQQKRILQAYFSLKQPTIYENATVANPRKENVLFSLNTSYDQVCEFGTGAKLFFNRHLHKQWVDDMPSAEKRENDVYLDHPFQRNDTTIFQLPKGYSVESLPAKVSYSFPLGKYSSEMSYQPEKGTVTSITTMDLNYHIIPAAQYPEAKAFFSQVMKDQGQKWILKKD